MSSTRQVIEVAQFKKQSINPSSYYVYALKEEKLNYFELPKNEIRLSNHIYIMLQNCFTSYQKAPYTYLASKLIDVASNKVSQEIEALEIVDEFAKQSKLYSINFVGKHEVIQNSVLFLLIDDCSQGSENSYLQLRNSKGEFLLMIKGFKIHSPDRRILKKFEGIFKGGNFIVINNESKTKRAMDCQYFEQICKSRNNFIYFQNSLKIVTDYRPFDEEETIFTLNSPEFSDLPICFIQTMKYGSVICSKNSLYLHFSKSFDELVDKHKQMRKLFSQQLDSLNTDVNFGGYSSIIKYCVLNILVTNQDKQNKLTFKQAIQTLIDFLSDAAKKCFEKNAMIEKRRKNAHFPDIMKHCKECKVCLKQYTEQKGIKKRNRRRESKSQDHKFQKSHQTQIKIKKTKYCCEGCTVIYGKQIPICVLCFKEFHYNVPHYMGNQYRQELYYEERKMPSDISSSDLVKSDEKQSFQSNPPGITDLQSQNKIGLELMKSMKSFQQIFFAQLSRFEDQLKGRDTQQRQEIGQNKQQSSDYLEY